MVRVYSGLDRVGELNRALVEEGVEVTASRVSEDNLEDHFVKLTGGSDEDPAPERRVGRRGWRR